MPKFVPDSTELLAGQLLCGIELRLIALFLLGGVVLVGFFGLGSDVL